MLFRHFHRFAADDAAVSGVTGVVLLAESHITIHTWPEHGFAAIDREHAEGLLEAAHVVERGVVEGGGAQLGCGHGGPPAERDTGADIGVDTPTVGS